LVSSSLVFLGVGLVLAGFFIREQILSGLKHQQGRISEEPQTGVAGAAEQATQMAMTVAMIHAEAAAFAATDGAHAALRHRSRFAEPSYRGLTGMLVTGAEIVLGNGTVGVQSDQFPAIAIPQDVNDDTACAQDLGSNLKQLQTVGRVV
jgi:hypothetical protein